MPELSLGMPPGTKVFLPAGLPIRGGVILTGPGVRCLGGEVPALVSRWRMQVKMSGHVRAAGPDPPPLFEDAVHRSRSELRASGTAGSKGGMARDDHHEAPPLRPSAAAATDQSTFATRRPRSSVVPDEVTQEAPRAARGAAARGESKTSAVAMLEDFASGRMEPSGGVPTDRARGGGRSELRRRLAAGGHQAAGARTAISDGPDRKGKGRGRRGREREESFEAPAPLSLAAFVPAEMVTSVFLLCSVFVVARFS